MPPTTDATPDVATGPPAAEVRLAPRLPVLWTRLAASIVLPLVLAGIGATAFCHLWWAVAAIVVAGGLVPWWTHHYGRRHVATFRCRLERGGLFVERGVWWRSCTFVPRDRVQHTDVDQGPLARRWGLAKLTVFTAGSSHGQIEIDDLEHADALRLRDELLGRHERPDG